MFFSCINWSIPSHYQAWFCKHWTRSLAWQFSFHNKLVLDLLVDSKLVRKFICSKIKTDMHLNYVRESCGCVAIQLHLLSRPSIFASKFVRTNFSFLFLSNKETFEIETSQVNITQVLTCAEFFSDVFSETKILRVVYKMIKLIRNL